jgi:hypothetical protein
VSDYPHGESRGYKRGCRCEPCREACAAYSRAYRAARSPKRFKPPKPWPCTVEGCEKPRTGTYQLCAMHRWRWKHHGTTDPGPKTHAPIAERYNRFVVRGPECWDWMGTKNNHGYGRLGSIYAHRVSYERTFGPIPKGMHVLHRCDNPPCTNPSHLMIGTHRDNMADMRLKGRVHGGKASGFVGRVTMAYVAEMRRLKAEGVNSKTIGDQFGISANYATQLISGRKTVRA